MDPLRIHAYKIHAIKKHKRQKFVGIVLLYSVSTLACTLFCSSPLWYPPFCATFNVIFFFSIPKICAFFFTSKVLFVVGNLIVIFLVGESKFFASKSTASDASYSDVYKCKSPKPRILPPPLAKCSSDQSCDEGERVGTIRGTEDMLKCCGGEVRFVERLKFEDLKRGEEEEEEEILPADELNKLADDFIARINRQRRLEVEYSTWS